MTSYSSVEEINHAISVTDNTLTKIIMLCMILFGALFLVIKKIHGDEESLNSRLLPSLIKKKTWDPLVSAAPFTLSMLQSHWLEIIGKPKLLLCAVILVSLIR